MAFRRSFSRFGRRGFRRGSFRRGGGSSKKWIAKHSLTSTAAIPNVPPIAGQLEAPPHFIPLVGPEDYGLEDATLVQVEKRERTNVIRSIGHFGIIMPNLVTEGQFIAFAELSWYLCAISSDAVDDVIALAAASVDPFAAFSNYTLNEEHGPALWRQPLKKWGTEFRVAAWSLVAGDINAWNTGVEMNRSWDIRVKQPLFYPMSWYLVVMGNLFYTATPPEAQTLLVSCMARTLITD